MESVHLSELIVCCVRRQESCGPELTLILSGPQSLFIKFSIVAVMSLSPVPSIDSVNMLRDSGCNTQRPSSKNPVLVYNFCLMQPKKYIRYLVWFVALCCSVCSLTSRRIIICWLGSSRAFQRQKGVQPLQIRLHQVRTAPNKPRFLIPEEIM